jgi:Protein of unknown function (DUF1488)
MPLITTGRPGVAVPQGIGFWMAVKHANPGKFVWVVVTAGALNQLDPSEFADQHTAVFNGSRSKIEDAASAKFDREGPEPNQEQEGQPVLLVRSNDLT